jgi:hypothetical protein
VLCLTPLVLSHGHAALGTLYAYQNAVKKAQALYGFDLEAALARREISAALYHTAGKGTRWVDDMVPTSIVSSQLCVCLCINLRASRVGWLSVAIRRPPTPAAF